MSIGVRAILILFSILTLFYIIGKIRQSKLQIEYSLFWIGFSVVLIIISIFPQIIYWFTDLIGIQSPVNFVFLVIIFILLIKSFMTTIELSHLESRLNTLVQEIALREKNKEDQADKKEKSIGK